MYQGRKTKILSLNTLLISCLLVLIGGALTGCNSGKTNQNETVIIVKLHGSAVLNTDNRLTANQNIGQDDAMAINAIAVKLNANLSKTFSAGNGWLSQNGELDQYISIRFNNSQPHSSYRIIKRLEKLKCVETAYQSPDQTDAVIAFQPL